MQSNAITEDVMSAHTAQVLRVANSVMYRGFSEIRNLDLAFARIGQRALIPLSAFLEMAELRGSRRPDGSLPEIKLLRPTAARVYGAFPAE